MPRARGTKQYRPLLQGLITEASPLDFPQGATIDELNFLYESEGNKRVKRKGLGVDLSLDWDISTIVNDADIDGIPTELFFWEEANIWILTISIQKITDDRENRGYAVLFYQADGTYIDYVYSDTGDVIRQQATEVTSRTSQINNSSVVVTCNGIGKFYHIELRSISSVRSLVVAQSTPYTRDFSAFSTDNAAATRKTVPITGPIPSDTVDLNYQYNVVNAGWIRESMPRESADSGNEGTPLAHIRTASGDNYPSLYESPNSYIILDGNTRVFSLTAWQQSDGQYVSQAPLGSQVEPLDDFVQRSVSDSFKAPSRLTAVKTISLE